MIKRFCGLTDYCFAPRLGSDPSMCENFHTWNEGLSLTAEQVLARLQSRLADVDKKISEATSWGAALAALGEEQRGLRRRIHHWSGNT
jgi:hypothetical protein